MPARTPRALWETALGQIELQVTRPNFDTWLRDTVGLAMEDGRFVVGVPSDFALEWLKSRMSATIDRALSQLLGHPISTSFEVLGLQNPDPPLPSNGDSPTASARPRAPNLNPRLTFESFTVVESNRLAYRAARQIASGDSPYNPLVIWAPSGLGKTHLLHAIARERVRAGGSVALLTGEQFVDGYARSVRAGHPHTFRDAYRQCALFILDDLQFLASRSASQEQFFHTFDALLSQECQLVAAIDQPPHSLTGFSCHLRSRLEAGLTVEISSPSRSEQRRILQAKAARLPSRPSTAVLDLILHQSHADIRTLEGALNRAAAYLTLSDRPPALESIRQALHPFQQPPEPPSPSSVLQAVSSHFGLSLDDLAGPSRARDVAYARHVAMYLLRRCAYCSLTHIGQLLGGRDHSTALNGCRRIDRELASLSSTRSDVSQLQDMLSPAGAA